MNAPIALGLDVSVRCTGMALMQEPSDWMADTAETNSAEEMPSRLQGLWKGLDGFLTEWFGSQPRNRVPSICAIERGFTGGGPSATVLGQAQGALIVKLDELGIPIIFVAPKTLKKYATGNGNATKEMMIDAAVKSFGFEKSKGTKAQAKKDEDKADALWLAYYALTECGD